MHPDLAPVADHLRTRNQIDAKVSQIIDRPMTAGHLGEWIASQVFDITLERSAVAAGIDGRFATGDLTGKTVNVKWYLKREGMLDMVVSSQPDFYLVLTGPPGPAVSSRGTVRPWVIDSVFLFDAEQLAEQQLNRAVRTGVASSVQNQQWEAAEIYPRQNCPALGLTAEQTAMLDLFRTPAPSA